MPESLVSRDKLRDLNSNAAACVADACLETRSKQRTEMETHRNREPLLPARFLNNIRRRRPLQLLDLLSIFFLDIFICDRIIINRKLIIRLTHQIRPRA